MEIFDWRIGAPHTRHREKIKINECILILPMGQVSARGLHLVFINLTSFNHHHHHLHLYSSPVQSSRAHALSHLNDIRRLVHALFETDRRGVARQVNVDWGIGGE